MMLQVVFWLCLVLVGGLANPQHLPEKNFEDSKDLKELLSEVSDAASKLDSLSHKFGEIERAECPGNEEICRLIRERLTKGKKDEREEVRVINGVLSSIQEKVDRLDRKMESGVASPMEYVNAMKGLERRLQYFQSAVIELGRGVRGPSRYVEASDDESSRAPRGSRASYGGDDDDDGIKHLGRNCKLLAGPYKKLLGSVDRLEDAIRDMNSKNGTLCAYRAQKTSLYKTSAFKDIKEMLEDISDDIKSLRKMSTREMNENEKILKKINKKLEKELKDDDKDDEKLKKSLKGYMVEQRRELEKTIKKALTKINDKDTDDDDDDDDDTDDSREKGRKNSDTDDDDDDEDNSCDDSDGCRRKKKGKDKSDDDDDDDDDDEDEDSDDDKKRGRKRSSYEKDDDDGKTDSDDDDDEDEDDSDDDRKKVRGKKNWENLSSRKNFQGDEKNYKDVEVMKNSASGYFGRQKLFGPLFAAGH